MIRVSLLQAAVALAIAAGAWLLDEPRAAQTALLCGGACALPSAMFAAHLAVLDRWQALAAASAVTPEALASRARTYAAAMLFGEFIKVASLIALLVLMILVYRQVVWKALLLTLGACLFVQPFALSWRNKKNS